MLQDNQIIIDVSEVSPELREKVAKYLQTIADIFITTGRPPAACAICCQYTGGGTPGE